MRWFALARGEGMKLLLVLAGVVLAGCTTAHVTRYTWASADPNLKQADIECLKETNKTYVPGLYGGGKAIRQTLYKDCIEQRGYAKLKTEDVPHPLDWDDGHKVYRLRPPGVTCGADQTCVLWR